jgi:hypothetical protein
MADEIEIHFDPARGDLTLTCGEVGFDRLRRAVCAEAGFEEICGHATDCVQQIDIVSPPLVPKGGRFGQAVVLLGCTVVGAALLFVFGVGVVAVVRWLAAHIA